MLHYRHMPILQAFWCMPILQAIRYMPIRQLAIWRLCHFMRLPIRSGMAVLKAVLLLWQGRVFKRAQKQLQQLWLW